MAYSKVLVVLIMEYSKVLIASSSSGNFGFLNGNHLALEYWAVLV